MIIDIIKASLINLVAAGNAAYRTFTAYGRGNEIVSGKIFQHYGFRSQPKQGADLVTVQYGNNSVSVAENDGNLYPVALKEGQVAVYADGADGSEVVIALHSNDNVEGGDKGLIDIHTANGSIQIIAGNNQITITQNNAGITAPSIKLGADPNDQLKKLCMESFADLLANHTHALDVPHGMTLAPLQYSAGMVSPVNSTLYPNAFTSVVEAE